jgi:hypothetical protein
MPPKHHKLLPDHIVTSQKITTVFFIVSGMRTLDLMNFIVCPKWSQNMDFVEVEIN